MLVAILFWLLLAPVEAQDALSVRPSQITVARAYGAVEQRTLLLSATRLITDVQIIPLDLSSADGTRNLVGTATISYTLPVDQLDSNDAITVPLHIYLGAAQSSEYKGDLLVRYSGGELVVPVTVRVKDQWGLPLLTIALGVIFGMALSTYRSRLQPRDDIRVRDAQLQTRMRADQRLPTTFQDQLRSHLMTMEVALRADDWTAARTALNAAELVWDRWNSNADGWLRQLNYAQSFEDTLRQIPSDVTYGQALRRTLADTIRLAPTLDGPHLLRDQLDPIALQINYYLRIITKLRALAERRMLLPEQQDKDFWGRKINDLIMQLENARPGDSTALQTLEGTIKTQEEALEAAIQAAKPEGGEVARSYGAPVAPGALPPAPVAAAPVTGQRPGWLPAGGWPALRLIAFICVSYLVGLGLLIWAGFAQLYGAQPTFGSNFLTDYFALFGWGFGAEATRASVSELLRGWIGLPTATTTQGP
jgi:hypothetical protein